MGLREGGTVLLLAPLGVGTAEAVTLAILTFAVQVLASLAGCGFYLFGHFPRFEGAPSSASLPLGGAVVEGQGDAQSVGGDPDQGRARKPSAAA
jgi:hypothetical protein